MKIVIDIPEDIYNRCTEFRLRCGEAEVLEGAVANGTPLPKKHGRLVDADVLVDGLEDNYELCMEVNATPTIIPSERE